MVSDILPLTWPFFIVEFEAVVLLALLSPPISIFINISQSRISFVNFICQVTLGRISLHNLSTSQVHTTGGTSSPHLRDEINYVTNDQQSHQLKHLARAPPPVHVRFHFHHHIATHLTIVAAFDDPNHLTSTTTTNLLRLSFTTNMCEISILPLRLRTQPSQPLQEFLYCCGCAGERFNEEGRAMLRIPFARMSWASMKLKDDGKQTGLCVIETGGLATLGTGEKSPMSELAEKFGRWRLNLAVEEEDDYRERRCRRRGRRSGRVEE